MAGKLGETRRDELLDGVMRIIAARGFSEVRVSDIAQELQCSVASLYKIAPSKDSLMVLTIARWGEVALAGIDAQASEGATPTDRARRYFRASSEVLRPLSHEFRDDVERFASARQAYRIISDRYVDRFVELLDEAVAAGEIQPRNTRFLAHLFRQIASVIRDERTLQASGLTAALAVDEVDSIIWDGLLACP